MSEATCSACGLQASIRSLFDLNGQIYCGSCVRTASENAKRSGQPSGYMPLINRSICARCNTYMGDQSTSVQIGIARFCGSCAPLIKDWGYPSWLKIGLAAVLALLVVALIHGKKYFHAGRAMYVGERLVGEGKYSDALPYLKETLTIAPSSDKASLLAAKAALMIGDVLSAQKALEGHDGGHYEDGQDAQFLEVNNLWDRANQALEKADQAGKLAKQDGKAAQAAKLMHEAATLYPQLAGFAFAAESLDAGAAFDRADFDAFLAISEHQWNEQNASETAAQLASALSCKYAVTGIIPFRQRAQEMMEKATQLAQGDKEALESLKEYAPRIQYRLDSRRIITKQQYDQLFRGGKTAAK
jgi:hypothetical protein